MLIVITAYFVLLLQSIGFSVVLSDYGNIFSASDELIFAIFKIIFNFFYCAATTILASIMYKLGEQQHEAENLKESFAKVNEEVMFSDTSLNQV